jgi:hypothetical protein
MSADNLLFQQPFTRKILTIIKYLAAELDTPHNGDELLFSILHYDFYNIPSDEIIKVCRRMNDKRDKVSLRQYLRDWHSAQGLTLFTPPAEQLLMEMSPMLENWLIKMPGMSLSQVYALITNEPRLQAAVNKETIETLATYIDGTTLEDFLRRYTYQSLTPGAPEITPLPESLINPLLAGFEMSVSSLNAYLDCPLGFFYKSLIKVPAGRTESMEFGSAIHHSVEKLFQKMQDHPQNTFPSTEDLLTEFNDYMQKNRAYFTSQAFEQRLAHGRNILTNYYNTYIHTWNKVVSVERNIRGVSVNNVPIKGIIDKLEFDGNRVNLVDYKSGSYEKALKRLQPGGEYWRQAIFYKILLDNYKQKNWQVVSMEFDFIEPDSNNIYHKEKIVITPEAIATVTGEIVSTWEKIQRKEFYKGCGKPYCRWCNFVKETSWIVPNL